ncbi:MAG: hypothetical protein ACRD9W_13760 [Terriglobia bacterium]
MTKPVCFNDYCDAVDTAMRRFFGIDVLEAGIDPDRIAAARDENIPPEDFALWFGEKYGLRMLSEFGDKRRQQ